MDGSRASQDQEKMARPPSRIDPSGPRPLFPLSSAIRHVPCAIRQVPSAIRIGVTQLGHPVRTCPGWPGQLVVRATLAFGGAVWWARPAIAALTFAMAACWLARALLEGTWRVLKSPMAPLGVLGLLLAMAQLVPLPAALAGRISPRSHAAYARGV